MAEHGMGWRPPADRSHETRYALATHEVARPSPVVIGVAWYAGFDTPVRKDGAWWIGLGEWGRVRGGHAVCLRPPLVRDVASAHAHFDQGTEGACVGFAASRAACLFNRKLYDGFPLYRAAQRRDPWPGEAYDGTSVNAGLDTLRLEGAWPVRAGRTTGPRLKDGVQSFWWARSVEEVMRALGTTEPYARLLNSWGTEWPAEVRVPWEAIDRLVREEGEFAVPVDRG